MVERLGLALLVVVIALGGCGGGEDDTSTPDETDAAPTSTVLDSFSTHDCSELFTHDDFAEVMGVPLGRIELSDTACDYISESGDANFDITITIGGAESFAAQQGGGEGTIDDLGDNNYFISGSGGSAGVHILVGDTHLTVAAESADPQVSEIDIARSEAVARVFLSRLP